MRNATRAVGDDCALTFLPAMTAEEEVGVVGAPLYGCDDCIGFASFVCPKHNCGLSNLNVWLLACILPLINSGSNLRESEWVLFHSLESGKWSGESGASFEKFAASLSSSTGVGGEVRYPTTIQIGSTLRKCWLLGSAVKLLLQPTCHKTFHVRVWKRVLVQYSKNIWTCTVQKKDGNLYGSTQSHSFPVGEGSFALCSWIYRTSQLLNISQNSSPLPMTCSKKETTVFGIMKLVH